MLETFPIKDEPVPPTNYGRGRKLKYPFDKLAVGKFFETTTRAVHASASSYGKRHKKKFIIRKLDPVPGEPQRWGVWRDHDPV
jgi:hypothetical protein